LALDVEAEERKPSRPPPARDSSIAQKAVRGASWSIATGLGSRILGLVGTLALTHFLLPDVIGEVSDAFVVASMASQLSTWGFGQYLIARPETGPDVTWHATFYHFVLGAFALSAVLILGPQLADFFHAPNLGLYLPGLVGAVFADRIASIPERLLARTMRFKAIGLMRTAGELTYTFVSLGLAIVGYGGMAIVWANVARSIIRAILMIGGVRLSDWLRPYRLSWETTRSMLVFGLPFAVSTNSAFASRRADNLVMSRLFGVATVGNYQMAYNLADVPRCRLASRSATCCCRRSRTSSRSTAARPSFAQLVSSAWSCSRWRSALARSRTRQPPRSSRVRGPTSPRCSSCCPPCRSRGRSDGPSPLTSSRASARAR
jgi:PST family polysaccharide transporter